VVAVTEPIARDLGERLEREVSVVTNGFDPEEAGQAGNSVDGLLTRGRHSMVYTGRAGVSGRSPRPLLDGLLELKERWPDVAERLEVIFAGPTTTEERALLGDTRLQGLVRSVGTLERRQTLALQEAADSLLVLAEGASGPSVATNKLFEYLAAGRPVFVLGAESEAARIVSETRAGLVAPGDAHAVAAALRELVEGGTEFRAEGIERFAWPVLAERFEEEIEAAVARG
jgi:glycosyltransferase involved in cell wall biosynthesis